MKNGTSRHGGEGGDAIASPIRLDDGRRRSSVDLKSYAHVDHGYAATVHKTQGMTVDRTHVLATPGTGRAFATYVAMSRHRDGTALHYGRDDFAGEQFNSGSTLARERPKDMALDYADRAGGAEKSDGVADERSNELGRLCAKAYEASRHRTSFTKARRTELAHSERVEASYAPSIAAPRSGAQAAHARKRCVKRYGRSDQGSAAAGPQQRKRLWSRTVAMAR